MLIVRMTLVQFDSLSSVKFDLGQINNLQKFTDALYLDTREAAVINLLRIEYNFINLVRQADIQQTEKFETNTSIIIELYTILLYISNI